MMRLRNQQNVEHVFERERERERQRELQDAHDRTARHQPQMRPHVAEKPHQRGPRNDAVEDALEKTAATLVGFVGSAGRLTNGTIRRLRRAGDHHGTTIWHADRLAVAQAPENMSIPVELKRLTHVGGESGDDAQGARR